MHNKKGTVSIIIVNWNTKDDLDNCLYSLQNVDNVNDIDIIVIDNDSKDGSREMVKEKYPNVQCINSGANIGFGNANNIGINLVNSEYTMFLNPDTIIEEKSITKMVEAMKKDASIGAVGPKMKYPNGKVQQLGIQWFPSPFTEFISLLFLTYSTMQSFRYILPLHNPNMNGYVRKLYGGCMLVKTELLKSVGGFDKRFFMYGEDVDLCIKILNTGYHLYYCAEAEVIHLCGSASKKAPSSFSIIMKCESINSLMDKYHGKLGSLLHRVLLFVGASFRIFMSLIISPVFIVNKKQERLCYSIIKHYYICMWTIGVKKIFQK